MKPRKTMEYFRREVFDLVGNEYSVLDDKYENANTKIMIKHNICGNEYFVSPNKFLQGRRCPTCAMKNRADKQRKGIETFINEVTKLVGDEYAVVGEYINGHEKIKMIHNSCGYEYLVSPAKFLSGRRCPKCGRISTHQKKTKTQLQFEKELYGLVRDEFKVESIYTRMHKPITLKHTKCGRSFEVLPTSVFSGSRCPFCTMEELIIKNTKKTEEFRQEVWNLVQDEYSVVSDYEGSHKKVIFRHNICNYEFEMSPTKFLTNHRCPRCRESKGEKKVEKCLIKLGVNFRTQVRFDECRNELPLPFDFAVYSADNSLICLIEYDGILHFKPKGFPESFKRIQITDKIKNSYCENKKIPFLRINYKDFDNVEVLVISFLRDKVSFNIDEDAYNKEIRRRINEGKKAETQKRKENRNRYINKDFERYKKIEQAGWIMQKALKNGEIIRPNNCEECGRECKPEAARLDYDKPLDISWLCRACRIKFNKTKSLKL